MKERILKIKNNSLNINDLESFVERVFEEFDINEALFGNISLAVQETALYILQLKDDVNDRTVFTVGSNRRDLEIEFIFTVGKETGIVKIVEETFNTGDMDSLGRENIFKIRSLTDKIEYLKNKIILVFNKGRLPGDITSERQGKISSYLNRETSTREIRK